jgi:hypothetical protein
MQLTARQLRTECAATELFVALHTGRQALKAHAKSSVRSEATPTGVLALVRLLARAAAEEAFADQANNNSAAAPDVTVAAQTQEQSDVAGQRS